jgi:ATP-dependent DNA helicase RecG
MDADIEADLRRILDGELPSALESITLDFKQEARSTGETEKILTDAAICFANAEGGTIVVGVDDDTSGPGAFIGTQLDAQTAQRRIYELTTPALLARSEEIWFEGTRLLVLTVPRSFDIHSDSTREGQATSRHGLPRNEPSRPGFPSRGAARSRLVRRTRHPVTCRCRP